MEDRGYEFDIPSKPFLSGLLFLSGRINHAIAKKVRILDFSKNREMSS